MESEHQSRNNSLNIQEPEKLCLALFFKYAFSFFSFPFLSVGLFIRFLFKYWGTGLNCEQEIEFENELETCHEMALLSTAGEAPFQIVFTVWLMLRGVLKPLDLGRTISKLHCLKGTADVTSNVLSF